MARKYDFISELYNRTCKTVVASPASWEAFLRSACYNYRLRFDEQLLVHAQRPDATAVLQIDDWNQKFGRWVNRGAHGIAVFEDADQRRQRLVHYFDISDTHPSRFSRRVPIWQMRDEYTAEVIDTLESTFGELNDKETLAVAIESAARNAVEDNIPDYLLDLIYSVKDSFLDGVSEEEITHIFKKAVRNSVAYMTMTRLGIEAGEYFEPDDLRDVVNFTTPATLNALGYATSDIAEMGLAEISRTILALDRQNRIIAEKTKADYNVGKEKPKGVLTMNEITYTRQGDYLLPNLTMPEQPELSMGRYARMRKKFLKEHHKVRYYNLLTSCALNEHLNDTERRANELEQMLTEQMAASEGVTENLKATDMMSWVRKMNSIRSRVQEIVMAEVIFA